MKTNSTAFIALILSCQFAFAQPISVEISPITWEQLDKSFLLVSNNSGDIIFDQTFDRAGCKNARRVAFEKVAGEQTHVTLFNQYTLNTEGSPLYLYNACTFYDVQSDLKVVNPPSYYLKPEFKSIVIWVEGVEEVDNFIVNSQTRNYEEYFYRMHNSVKGIKIKYDHQKGSDLFLALSCNGEGSYRYVYLPEGEILDEQTFEYSDLPSDLEIVEIPLPYKAGWNATVKAKNEDTQGQCYLYETKKPYQTDTLRFFTPGSYFLFDYEVSLFDPEKPAGNLVSYFVNGSGLPVFPKINEDDFYYESASIYKDSFLLSLGGRYDKFDVSYSVINFMEKPSLNGTPSRIPQGSSDWLIQGPAQEKIKFVFPKIPAYIQEGFKSLSTDATTHSFRSYRYYVGLVKTLESGGIVRMTESVKKSDGL